jgi:hypothetical protein
MSILPFQTRREDGRPEWQLIYEVLIDLSIGDLLRYDALDELLERDFRRAGAGRTPLARAMVELEKTHQRTLRNVLNVGYEVVEGGAQVVLAQQQAHRGHRRFRRSAVLASTTRRDALNYEQTKRLDALQLMVERLEAESRRVNRRMDDIEAAR